MKNLIYVFVLVCFIACETKTNQQAKDKTQKYNTTQVEKPAEKEIPQEDKVVNVSPQKEAVKTISKEALIGSYVGMFEAKEFDEEKDYTHSNKINISIDKIDGQTIEGHSVVAGNNRPFKGVLTALKDNAFEAKVEEPGDDRYDGTFSFKIYPDEDRVKGTWVANDKKLLVTKREYNLEKRVFKYDPTIEMDVEGDFISFYGTYNRATGEEEFLGGDFNKKNASTDKITKADVENMKRGDLEVMRNAIYARHGYSFKNRRMRYVFDHVDWYFPVSTDIRAQLTSLEKENIDLIKRYEQHAESYYDVFSR